MARMLTQNFRGAYNQILQAATNCELLRDQVHSEFGKVSKELRELAGRLLLIKEALEHNAQHQD